MFCHSNYVLNEPHGEKTNKLHMQKTKVQISFAITAKLIRAFVFATRIVLFVGFLVSWSINGCE